MTSATDICAADSRVELPRGAGLPTRAVEEDICTVGHTVLAGTVSQRLDGRLHPAPARPDLRQGHHGTVPCIVRNRVLSGV